MKSFVHKQYHGGRCGCKEAQNGVFKTLYSLFFCNYRCYIKLYTEYVHANYKDVASNNNCYVCLDLSIYIFTTEEKRVQGG